ncbi:BrnT family toxin [Phormidesmis sp. 146-35]
MNVSYTLHKIQFEWDSNKASSNFIKHRVNFETACETFFDPFLQVEDAGYIDGEEREAVIGVTVDWRLLYVVYVLREDIIRLISARLATNSERIRYEDQ